jgi:hypothetical protein
MQKTLAAPHTRPNPVSTRGGGKTNRYARAQGCQPLGAAVTPAIAKTIHKEGLACIQSHLSYMAGHRVGPRRTWLLVLGVWGGVAGLCAGPIPSPTSYLGPDCVSPWSQFLSQGYGSRKH